jgi:hypothetical protein
MADVYWRFGECPVPHLYYDTSGDEKRLKRLQSTVPQRATWMVKERSSFCADRPSCLHRDKLATGRVVKPEFWEE